MAANFVCREISETLGVFVLILGVLTAEKELEKYWANKITNSRNPSLTLKKFLYFENYLKLVRLEVSSLDKCRKHSTHAVLFCGGGPLPLTSIILAKNFGISSTIIDNNKEAVVLSQKLVAALNLQSKITIFYKDARSFRNYHSFSVIYVAALVGISRKEQKTIFSKIKTAAQKNTHILARSSYGNRELLYRPIKKNILDMFDVRLTINPRSEIINSIIVMRSA